MNLKPNIVIPLAASYNTRAGGQTVGFTQNRDQRKINSFYDPVKNSVTGRTTLYLCKRYGATLETSTLGASGQSSYLLISPPGASGGDPPWMFSVSSAVVRASDTTTTVAISSTPYRPVYVDETGINNVETVVLQLAQNESTAQQVFYASTIATWTEVVSTFSTFTHRGKMEFMDGWGFTLTSSNRIQNSNLNTVSTWPVENFIDKSIQLDYPKGLAKVNNQIVAFGEESAEVFVNGGLSPAPLVRIPHLAAKIGLQVRSDATGGHYYATIINKMYFVGRAGGRSNIGAYSYDGSRFEKISNNVIDRFFAASNPRSVEKLSLYGRTGIAFDLNGPDVSPQRWLVFFPEVNEWFEWDSVAVRAVNNGNHFLGMGANQHRIYNFQSQTRWMDDTSTYEFRHQFDLPQEGNNRKQMDFMGVVGSTELSTTTSALSAAVSDDNWQTTTNIGTIDLTSQEKMVTRCGAFQERGVVLTHSGNTEVRLETFIARIR